MPTTREVLDTTIALEKQSMALYASFAKVFAGDSALHDFWFGMARDEARHVGALDLVSDRARTGREARPAQSGLARRRDHRATARAAREFENRAKPGLSLEQALKIALEVEETELEDLVADLLKALKCAMSTSAACGCWCMTSASSAT